jgi:hypothetical protein
MELEDNLIMLLKSEINLNERVTIGSEGLQAVIWAVTRCLYLAPFAHSDFSPSRYNFSLNQTLTERI